MENQRSRIELKRIEEICFPKDKENNCLKEINLSSNNNRKASAPAGSFNRKSNLLIWEKYEEKTKNLQKNFQRFAEKCMKSHKPKVKTINCFPKENNIEINNSEIERFIEWLYNFSEILNPFLSLDDQSKFNAAIKISEKTLKELSMHNTSELVNYETVLKDFNDVIGILESLIQQKLANFNDSDMSSKELSLMNESSGLLDIIEKFNNSLIKTRIAKKNSISLPVVTE